MLALEGVRSLGAAQADRSSVARTSYVANVGSIGFHGCEGPQPSKIRNDYRSLILALEGVRSLGAAQADRSFVARASYVANVGPLLDSTAARDRSPPRSGTTIEALITIWRAPGPSVPRKAIVSLFGRDKVCVQRWLYRVPRLRGAAALQVRNDSSASAQANSTSLVRGLARIGIDSRKSKLVRNCVMHRNKYLTFLHRVGYDGGYRYLPATRCY